MRWRKIHPKMELQTTQTERVLDILAAALLLAMFGVAAFYYPELPEKIGTHFDASGTPDRLNSKSHLFILPILGLVMGSFLQIATHFPHRFNYVHTITPENMERSYRGGRLLIRLVRLEIFVLFLYLTWATAQVALSGGGKFNSAFVFLFIFLIPATAFGVLLKAR